MHIAPYDNQNKAIVDAENETVPLNYFNIIKLKQGQVEVEWVDATWGSWKELIESEEYLELKRTADGKLNKSGGDVSKGMGNGKGNKGLAQKGAVIKILGVM